MKITPEQGFLSIPAIVALSVFGLVAYLVIASTAPFKDKVQSTINPKPDSNAAEGIAAPELKSRQTDQIVVKYKTAISPTLRDELINRIKQRVNARLQKRLAELNYDVLKVDTARLQEALDILKLDPDVVLAEPDHIAQAGFVPNDPIFVNQWDLQKVKAPQAWDKQKGSSAVKVAVIDSGVDSSYTDIGVKIVGRVNFTDEGDTDSLGHGTAVANIVAAATNNNYGQASIGFNTSILSVKVLRSDDTAFHSWMAEGIRWSADNGAKVINMSLWGTSPGQILEDAINYAWSRGVVVVAIAGNSGSDGLIYPGFYTNAIAVAATDQNDNKASFSTYGTWVDIAAPGVQIYGGCNGGSSCVSGCGTNNPDCWWNGTSMAAPIVAGAAALVFAQNPTWTNTQVRAKLEQSADPIAGTGTNWMNGRLNVCNALDCLTSTPSPVPTPTISPTNAPTPLPQPDLVVTNITWTPAQPVDGQQVTFSAEIKNQGTVSTPNNVIHGVLFKVKGVNTVWSDNSLAALGVGQSRTLTANTGPTGSNTWTAQPGINGVIAIVDDINRIIESNETNNELSRLVTVHPSPTPTATPTSLPTPTRTPTPTPTSVPFTAPQVSFVGSCVSSSSVFNVSWTNPQTAVQYVDVSTSSTFPEPDGFYHKQVSGTSTTGPSGFVSYPSGVPIPGLLPNTQYFVRLWNGVHSPSSSFTTPNRCVTPTPVPTPTPTRTPTPTPVPTPVFLLGDTDKNGVVDIFDYNNVMKDYDKVGTGLLGDTDKDNDCDLFDYNNVMKDYGKTP